MRSSAIRGIRATQAVFARSFDKKFPQVGRKKAWEGQDKDEFFRSKYAHVHARQKQNKQYGENRNDRNQTEKKFRSDTRDRSTKDRSDNQSDKKNPFDRYFGDNYTPERQPHQERFQNRSSFQDRRNQRGNEWGRYEQGRDRREKTPKLQPNPWKEYVFGTGPVIAAIQGAKRDAYTKIYTTYSEGELSDKIKTAASEKDIAIEYDQKKMQLDILTHNKVHNGVVLETKKIDLPIVAHLGPSTPQKYSITSLYANKPQNVSAATRRSKPNPLGLYIDQVTDSHNIGAIARSAYLLGVDFIVMSEKNCAKLSPVVAKASAGAIDLVDIYNVTKPLEFFEQSRENGWNLVCTLPDPSKFAKGKGTLQASELSNALEKSPCLLVLGSEGEGLRTSLINRCSSAVSLSGDPSSRIDSFNVSVAAALLLSKFLPPTGLDK